MLAVADGSGGRIAILAGVLAALGLIRVKRRAMVARLCASQARRKAARPSGLPVVSAVRRLARVYFVPDSFSKTARQ